MDFVQESVVRDMGGGKLEALIYPDYERADALRMNHKELDKTLQGLRSEWNKVLPAYMNISKITLFPEEFEKTPKRSIKRYIYNTH
jgi:long-chain acyl-CoA synthetase